MAKFHSCAAPGGALRHFITDDPNLYNNTLHSFARFSDFPLIAQIDYRANDPQLLKTSHARFHH
jgi:hypothetical protein